MPYFSFEKIQIGSITIYVLGLFIALGFLISFIFVLKKNKVDRNLILDSFTWLLVGAIIGLRLGYVLQYLDEFSNPIDIFKVWEGGMTFHGGLLGLLIAGILFAKIKKISFKKFLSIADQFSLFAPLGIAIGRIGCFLVNGHQGSLAFWGIVWPDGTIRHNVALYLIIANLIIFLILKLSKFHKPGSLFFSFLILYSISRFFLDFTRSTGTILSDPRYYGLSTAQWLSIIIILGIIVIRYKSFKGRSF